MSFRNQQKTVTTQPQKYFISNDSRKDKGGLPNGTYYFVLGVGTTTKNKAKEFMTVDELNEQVLFFDKATFYVKEVGEKGQYVNWHFTNSGNDPIVQLGYGVVTQSGALTNTKDRNEAKLMKIYDGKGAYTRYLQRQYHVPVVMVDEELNVEKGTPGILIITASQAQEIFKLAENLKMLKSNKGLAGRVLQLTKNSELKMKAYAWKLLEADNLMTPDLQDIFNSIQQRELEVLEGIYTEVNGGESENEDEAAQKVWNYLCNLAGMSYDQFYAQYNIRSATKIDPNPTEVINFLNEDVA